MASVAYNDGAEFGAALWEVMGQPDRTKTNQGAVFNVAKRFAKWGGYREMDSGLDWIAGFSDGFTGRTGQSALPPASE